MVLRLRFGLRKRGGGGRGDKRDGDGYDAGYHRTGTTPLGSVRHEGVPPLESGVPTGRDPTDCVFRVRSGTAPFPIDSKH
ncbi:hypothetical protein GCM10009839_17730 [Catenulispora yoronensis]|uniref:Uncharacterized protein n=1 Tax=Catenulispora yoronensis TaxID=450799 RepID=A0ABP5F9A9_9ACTN